MSVAEQEIGPTYSGISKHCSNDWSSILFQHKHPPTLHEPLLFLSEPDHIATFYI